MRGKKTLVRTIVLLAANLFFLTVAPVGGSPRTEKPQPSLVEMKLEVFEGIREGRVEPVRTVTSSFLRHTFSASLKTEETLEKEETQLRRVFNLKSVQLLTEANLSWPQLRSKDFHMFRLDSKEYAIVVTLLRINDENRVSCRVEVMEQEGEKKNSLLDSELTVDRNVIATFGFEDRSGKPYFLSLKVQKIVFPVTAGFPEGQVGGVVGGRIEGKPVEVKGDIKPPRLIKKVDPVYPEEARQAGIEWVVILEVTTDVHGRVAGIKVLRSVPMLDAAAIEAVKQWVYEPVIIDGEPRPVVFTVTVSFRLKDRLN